MPRTLNVLERVESASMCLMTEPPWLPVAPKTVMSLDIMASKFFVCVDNSKSYGRELLVEEVVFCSMLFSCQRFVLLYIRLKSRFVYGC